MRWLFICLLIFAFATRGSAMGLPGDTIRVLAIGNSFSVDAVEKYLVELTDAAGIPVVIGSLAIAGGSLEQHLDNANKDAAPYIYTRIAGKEDKTTIFNQAIGAIVASEPWDYISFQQVSQLSGIVETHAASLPALMDYVKARTTNPRVKYILHQTWAYAQDSGHGGFSNYGNDQLEMYGAIVAAYEKVQRLVSADFVIPAGTAVQNARTSSIGDRFTRDGFHLEDTYGRYVVACTWFEKLFGQKATGNAFVPVDIPEEYRRIAQLAAHYAVQSPNRITTMATLEKQ